MTRLLFCIIIFGVVVGCMQSYDATRVVKVIDFEISPDEDKVAFSALTPVGNSDIWVVDIDGTNLKKITFKDYSPSNRIARFFRKHNWRNFFEIDMRFPVWTKDGRIAFCQKLTKHDVQGVHIVSLRFWTINTDGGDKRLETDKDKSAQKRPSGLISKYKTSERSEKHGKNVYLKDDILWILDDGNSTPKKLIQ